MNEEAINRVLECLARLDKEIRLIPTVLMSHSPKLRALVEVEEARQIILKELNPHGQTNHNGSRTRGA